MYFLSNMAINIQWFVNSVSVYGPTPRKCKTVLINFHLVSMIDSFFCTSTAQSSLIPDTASFTPNVSGIYTFQGQVISPTYNGSKSITFQVQDGINMNVSTIPAFASQLRSGNLCSYPNKVQSQDLEYTDRA